MTANWRNLRERVDRSWLGARHWTERVLAELEFADNLCELQPRQAAAWRKLIDQAAAAFAGAADSADAAAVRAAALEAERILAPLGAAAKSYTLHCVGHAHIDMNWMWSWPETVAATLDTFRTMLRLLAEYPDFHFSQSQASVYRIVEEYAPDMLPEIAARVKEGRWEVTASHWVEGDKNLAGGESLCRHLLYTREYLEGLFGLKPADVPIDWSPDTFGHAATMPTYLTRGGVKYLYLHRPGLDGPVPEERPRAFWWQAPDGSRVLVFNHAHIGYNSIFSPGMFRHSVDLAKKSGLKDMLFVHGVGDHGGGPTRRSLETGLDMRDWPIYPTILFTTAKAFYEKLAQAGDQLPTLKGELNRELTGCYTTETLIKKANRFSENRLVNAESAAALAQLAAGGTYAKADLTAAWRDTLFSHFHDILPGSGVHDTRTFTHGLYQKIMASAGQIEIQALRRLAARVDTAAQAKSERRDLPALFVSDSVGAGVGFTSDNGRITGYDCSAGQGDRPFLIFNPNGHDRTEVIEATVWDNSPAGAVTPLKERTFVVRDANGQELPTQKVRNGDYWGHQYMTLAFPAAAAGLGYSVQTLAEGEAPAGAAGVRQLGKKPTCSYHPVEEGLEGLENEFTRVWIDPRNGGIRELRDLRSGFVAIKLARPAPVLEFAVERPHPTSAWSVVPIEAAEPAQIKAVRRGLSGPYKATVEFDLQWRESNFTLVYELRQGDPRLYVHLTGVWFQRGTDQTGIPSLRLALPLNLTDAAGRYEIPFGAVDRTLNGAEEVPALEWAQVTGKCGKQTGGCLLLNDSKHGHSLDGSTLRLTLIRSSYSPDILPEIGQHEVHLALMPFGGELPVAEATALARDLNHPLRVVGTDVHEGELPNAAQFVKLEPETVVLSSLKAAEDGRGLIVRLYETAGKKTTAKLKLNEKLLGKLKSASETDLLENPAESDSAKAGKDGASVTVPPLGLATVRLEFGK